MDDGVLETGEGRGNPTGPCVAWATKSCWSRTQQRGAEDSTAARRQKIDPCTYPAHPPTFGDPLADLATPRSA